MRDLVLQPYLVEYQLCSEKRRWVGMVVEDVNAAEIRGWAVGLSNLHPRIAKHFVRAEPRLGGRVALERKVGYSYECRK